jgi:hypothetical protein
VAAARRRTRRRARADGPVRGLICRGAERPKPHEVPFGVAGSANTQLINRIEQQAGTALKIKTYKTEADMRDAIDPQDIFGALEVNGNQATLFVASASGSGAAKLFEGAAPDVAKRLGVKVTVKDLKPLPKSDPNGLTVFYVALGCIIYGFSGVTMALGAAPQTPLRRLVPALLVARVRRPNRCIRRVPNRVPNSANLTLPSHT